jgi:hypothetical protein
MQIEKPSFAAGNLDLAITVANQFLKGERGFFDEVRQIPAFDYSKHVATGKPVSGKEVVEELSRKVDVTVQTYKPWNPWTRALAKTLPGTVIYLNARTLDRSVPSLVATLIHESVHIADNAQKALSFGHGNNYAAGKENSAPYKLDAIAERIASKVNA